MKRSARADAANGWRAGPDPTRSAEGVRARHTGSGIPVAGPEAGRSAALERASDRATGASGPNLSSGGRNPLGTRGGVSALGDTDGPLGPPGSDGRAGIGRRPRNPSQTRSGSANTLARLRQVIAQVPPGRVITYGQVASAAGFPRGARLTVWALQRARELPWHRVVAAGGRIALLGIDGEGQRRLLRIEGVTFVEGRVRMERHGWTPRTTGAVRRPLRGR
jgi:methylated-DNA-protein-cysteine methyltransferase-like protein